MLKEHSKNFSFPLILFFSLAVGLAISRFWQCSWLVNFGLFCLLIFIWWAIKEISKTYILLIIGLVSYGSFLNKIDAVNHLSLEKFDKKEIAVTGKIISIEKKKYTKEAVIKVLNFPEVNLLAILKVDTPICLGDKVTLKGNFSLSSPKKNPGLFSFSSYLLQKKIYGILKVNQDGIVIIKENKINKYINKFIFSPFDALEDKEGKIIKGMIWGRKEELDWLAEMTFKYTGTYHLLVASGSNVAMIVGLVYILGYLMGFELRYRAWLSFAGMGIYLLIAGFSPPLVRATIMAISLQTGVVLRREVNNLDALGGAGWLMLLADPRMVADLSFWFSFITLLSILWLSPFFYSILNKLPSTINLIISGTLSAQIGILPLSLFYFHYFSLVAPLANLLWAAINSLLFPIVALWWLSSFSLFEIANLLGKLMVLLTRFSIKANEILVNIPGAYFSGIYVSLLFIIGYYIALISFLLFKDKLKWLLIVLNIWLLWSNLTWLNSNLTHQGNIYFFYVGEGESVFIRCPKGETILIDGGRSEKTVSEILHALEVKSIDLVLLSHPDIDHLGGLKGVLNDFPVKQVITGYISKDSRDYIKFKKIIQKKGIPLTKVSEGTKIICYPSKCILEILNPPSNLFPGENDNSLVIKFTYKAFSCLIPGDIEEVAQKYLLRKPTLFLRADVLLFPHHGACPYIKEWVEKINPQVTVIQSGENNPYHHPCPEVIKGLTQLGTTFYRTDREGMIKITFNQSRFSTNTFLFPRKRNFNSFSSQVIGSSSN